MMKFPVYAPVIIPTLCRFEHFKRCVESLKRCTGAEYTDVYIGVDYPSKESHWEGYRKICNYVSEVTGFKSFNVILRDCNFGAEKNTIDLRERVKEKYDRCIFSEDDNEFAPNFLEYMNGGLERYKDNPRVLRICGCLMPWGIDADYYLDSYPLNAFPAKDYNASGIGIWFSKLFPIPYTKESILKSFPLTVKTMRYGYWQAITRFIHQIYKESQLPDVCLRLYCAFHGYYCIFPRISKVKNWGYDGTGINSDNNPHWIDVVTLDTSDSFTFDDIEIKDYGEVKEFIGRLYGVQGIRKKLRVINVYLYYRLTGRRMKDIPKGQRFKYLFSRRVSIKPEMRK